MYSFSTSRSCELPRQLLVRRDRSWPRPSGRRSRDRADGRCPGRSSPPTPLRSFDVVEQRVDQRAAAVPGAGMDDHAGRLVDDDDVAGPRRRCASGSASGSAVAGDRRRDVDDECLRPHWTGVTRLAAVPPAPSTRPSLISRWICERDCSGRSAVRKASRRAPSCSSAAIVRRASVTRPSRRLVRGGRRRWRRRRARGTTSIAMASGASTIEMNCDVETASRSMPRGVAAEELDDEARDAVEQHVAPEGRPGKRPPLRSVASSRTRISSSAPAS